MQTLLYLILTVVRLQFPSYKSSRHSQFTSAGIKCQGQQSQCKKTESMKISEYEQNALDNSELFDV